MYNALMRLVIVTLAVVGVAVGLGAVARRISRQDPQATHHPWFDRPAWDLRAPADPCVNAAGTDDAIVVLPVRRTPDAWRVRCSSSPELGAFLASDPHADWLIDVEAGAGEDLDDLVDLLTKVPGKRIGVLAASQRAARALRKKAPQWAYAADDASLLRLHLFTSIYLETVVEFWPDFVIARPSGVARLFEGERAELARRRKVVVWDGGDDRRAAPFDVVGSIARP